MVTLAISSGHGKFVRGAKGHLDEVDEARRVVAEVARVMGAAGVMCRTFNDDTSKTVNANLNAIVSWHKKQTSADIHVSVHFNAFSKTDKAMGTEVCHRSQSTLAARVSKAIADGGMFINRGAKQRTNLYFLNNLTAKPAILLEICFVDSTEDSRLYNQHFSKICGAIATSIGGITTAPPPQPPPSGRPVVRRGDKNDHVKSLQRTLGLSDDGDFGPLTDAAVKGFQRGHAVAADGVVGPITWRLLDELDLRMEAGNDGIDEDLEGRIDQLVTRSGVNSINWPSRGRAPAGYYLGCAKSFALVVERYRKGDGAAMIMARAESGNGETDALTWYKGELNNFGMKVDKSGLDTLRALWVMLVGAGMRESTGNHWKGKDPGAANTTADTCEAGAWQTSWNMNTASGEIRKLFDEYRVDPNAFRPDFTVGVSPKAADLENYGSGTGVTYQFLAKYSPAFAAMTTAVGMRLRRKHWGPINRKEVTIEPRINDLLKDIQSLVENREPQGVA